jgi:hypothetical protein
MTADEGNQTSTRSISGQRSSTAMGMGRGNYVEREGGRVGLVRAGRGDKVEVDRAVTYLSETIGGTRKRRTGTRYRAAPLGIITHD